MVLTILFVFKGIRPVHVSEMMADSKELPTRDFGMLLIYGAHCCLEEVQFDIVDQES